MTDYVVKSWKDVLPGAIVKSKRGNTYVLLSDSEGNRAVYTSKGTYLRVNDDDLTIGKNHDPIQSIAIFDATPVLNAISEGIKMVYTGRPACATLVTIYTAEDPRVTAAKADIAAAEALIADRKRTIAMYQ